MNILCSRKYEPFLGKVASTLGQFWRIRRGLFWTAWRSAQSESTLSTIKKKIEEAPLKAASSSARMFSDKTWSPNPPPPPPYTPYTLPACKSWFIALLPLLLQMHKSRANNPFLFSQFAKFFAHHLIEKSCSPSRASSSTSTTPSDASLIFLALLWTQRRDENDKKIGFSLLASQSQVSNSAKKDAWKNGPYVCTRGGHITPPPSPDPPPPLDGGERSSMCWCEPTLSTSTLPPHTRTTPSPALTYGMERGQK